MRKELSDSLMDAERLLEIFQKMPSVADGDDARPLILGDGEISFQKVDFSYDPRKATLKGIDFTVSGGSTVALVGETGGGKSTILNLLQRFYDVSAGSILIDGQDIRNVSLSRYAICTPRLGLVFCKYKLNLFDIRLTFIRSLREKMGIVPQSAELFNDTIMNNVRYARLNASDNEVYEACKAAAIHDKIMSFPDGTVFSYEPFCVFPADFDIGYNSMAGDDGV